MIPFWCAQYSDVDRDPDVLPAVRLPTARLQLKAKPDQTWKLEKETVGGTRATRGRKVWTEATSDLGFMRLIKVFSPRYSVGR